jgi:group I intron endonuclease
VFTIYSVTNKLDDKRYIGKTKATRFKRRCREHQWNARAGFPDPLYVAMRQDGIDNFIFDILATCETEEQTLAEEAWWVKFFGSHVSIHGYNRTPTGHSRGHKASEETRALIGAAGRGVKKSEEHRANLSFALRGRSVPESTRVKNRLAGQKSSARFCKPVVQLTQEGTLIARHVSIKSAARCAGVSVAGISLCVSGKNRHTAGGFAWTYL